MSKKVLTIQNGGNSSISPNIGPDGNQVVFGGNLNSGLHIAGYENMLEWYVKGPTNLSRLLSRDGKWAFTTNHYDTVLSFTDEVNLILEGLKSGFGAN